MVTLVVTFVVTLVRPGHALTILRLWHRNRALFRCGEKTRKGRLPIDWTENPLCQDSAHGVMQGVNHGVMQGVVQKYAFTCEFLRVVTGK